MSKHAEKGVRTGIASAKFATLYCQYIMMKKFVSHALLIQKKLIKF